MEVTLLAIDWLNELDQMITKGQSVLACTGAGEKEWVIGKPIEQLRGVAQRVADARKSAVNIVSLASHLEALPGDLFLVPTKIVDAPDPRGNPQVKWSLVDTKEAAEMMRDVKFGPSPFFTIQTVECVEPTVTAKVQPQE